MTKHYGFIQAIPYLMMVVTILSVHHQSNLKLTDYDYVSLWEAQSVVTSIYISGDAQRVISTSTDKLIRIYQLRDGKLELDGIINDNVNSVQSVTTTVNGSFLYCGGYYEPLRIYLNNGVDDGYVLRQSFENIGWVKSVDVSQDGNTLVITSSDVQAMIYTFNQTSQEYTLLQIIKNQAQFSEKSVITLDGKFIITVGWDNFTRVYMRTQNSYNLIQKINSLSINFAVAVNRDGSYLATGGEDGIIEVYKLNAGQFTLIKQIIYGRWVFSLSMNSNASYLMVGGTDGAATLYDLLTFKVADEFEGLQGNILTVKLGNNADFVGIGSSDNSVRIYFKCRVQNCGDCFWKDMCQQCNPTYNLTNNVCNCNDGQSVSSITNECVSCKVQDCVQCDQQQVCNICKSSWWIVVNEGKCVMGWYVILLICLASLLLVAGIIIVAILVKRRLKKNKTKLIEEEVEK